MPGSGDDPADPTGGFSGDPSGASQYWGRQRFDDCALMAVTDVVGELTGNKPSEEEIIALATSTANSRDSQTIYTLPPSNPDAGAGAVSRQDQLPVIGDLPILLSHYGVDSFHTDDSISAGGGPPTGMPAVEAALNAGKKVMVTLNGATIWDQPGDRTVYDHAVVVTGVDSGAGIVHFNDSAVSSRGPDSQVSFTTFEDAWKTSNHAMVVAG